MNPTLAIAHELVRRGEQVVYYMTEAFRVMVEASGARFESYQSSIGMQAPSGGLLRSPAGLLGALSLLRVRESKQVLPQVLERLRAEQADVILYDRMCLWARLAAQILQVPVVLLNPTYASHEQPRFGPQQATEAQPGVLAMFSSVQAGLDELCATYGLPRIDTRTLMGHHEALNIVFLPRAFQPGGEIFDERFVFVGPSIVPRQEAQAFQLERLEGQPMLFISLGTFYNNRPEFFKLCIEVFRGQPWQVVMAHGKSVDPAALGEIPANFLLAPYVPQLEVLQRASVFVTHGGMNSTMESLYYGVPMVLVPQQIEQEKTAQRRAELGLGIALDPYTLTVEALRTAVEQAPSFRANVRAMQQAVRAAGGYQSAADAITGYTSSLKHASKQAQAVGRAYLVEILKLIHNQQFPVLICLDPSRRHIFFNRFIYLFPMPLYRKPLGKISAL